MAKAKSKGGKPPVKGGRTTPKTTAKTTARNVGTTEAGRAKPAKAAAKPAAKDAAAATSKAVAKSKPVKPAATPGLANKGGGDRVGSGGSGLRPRPAPTKRTTPSPSARYTPPIPKSEKISPLWVPILMFACLGLGMAIIILNYVNVLPGDDPSNVYLMVGLGLITVGFITATKYH